ncbi:MAG TPA: transporter substrate-binding domain-containing protein [Flavobacteriaceae bacterium]|nr:transporter substrate-binding domain-containing protein [Flavobacteriaceae bacterium]
MNIIDKELYKHFFLCCVVLLFATHFTKAQNVEQQTVNDTLVVGVAGSEPFVFDDGDSGIAIEIWNDIAVQRGWDFKYIPYDDVSEALDALNQHNLDVVVGPTSITANRLETNSFSQPYYNSSISIISRSGDMSLWQRIKPLFSFKLLIAVGIFLIILAIVGGLLWLAERKKSPEQFPSDPIRGIGDGMWLAIVTMSTTGYGDKAPITLLGRIIAGSWMVISIIFATSMVAGIASTLTLSTLGTSPISSLEQLSGRKAATVAGSPSQEFLKSNKINIKGVKDLDEAMEELENKSVDAVVYDRPQLLYYMKEHDDVDLYLSQGEYYKQGYGFAFRNNSPLISQVNLTLLELSESQEVEDIIHRYIERDE